MHGHLGGLPPVVDLAAEQRAGRAARRRRRPADLRPRPLRRRAGSDAGRVLLAQRRRGVGLGGRRGGWRRVRGPLRRIRCAHHRDGDHRQRRGRLVALAQQHGVPLTPIGQTGGEETIVEGQFEVAVTEAKAAWSATLPDALLGLTFFIRRLSTSRWLYRTVDCDPGWNSDVPFGGAFAFEPPK